MFLENPSQYNKSSPQPRILCGHQGRWRGVLKNPRPLRRATETPFDCLRFGQRPARDFPRRADNRPRRGIRLPHRQVPQKTSCTNRQAYHLYHPPTVVRHLEHVRSSSAVEQGRVRVLRGNWRRRGVFRGAGLLEEINTDFDRRGNVAEVLLEEMKHMRKSTSMASQSANGAALFSSPGPVICGIDF